MVSVTNVLVHPLTLCWMLKDRYPVRNLLLVFSDGPATQYQHKGNFYLLSKEPFKKGCEDIRWSFLESSHGKEAPDGAGVPLESQLTMLFAMKGYPHRRGHVHTAKKLQWNSFCERKCWEKSQRNEKCAHTCASQRNNENPPSDQSVSRAN